MTFYEKYQILCRNVGKSTSAVANAIGLNNSSVTCWKRGSKPKAETIKKLSEYFGVSVDYLIGLTDDPHPTRSVDKDLTASSESQPHTPSSGDDTTHRVLDRNLLLYFGDYFRIREIKVGEGDKIVVTYDFKDKGLNIVEFHKLLNILLRMAERYDFKVNDLFQIIRLTDRTMSDAVRYLKVVQGDAPITSKMADIISSAEEDTDKPEEEGE